MKHWQYIGTILTGIAALITAGVGLYEKIHTVHAELTNNKQVNVKQIKQYGVVNDKDGWVNLREHADASSPAIARLLNDSNVEIISKEGNWFKVSTESGRIGYIYFDRLLLFNINLQR